MASEGELIWNKLPHEVIESIFSRLSVYDIVRAASTCRRLRAFISSPSTLLSSSSLSPLALVYPFDIPCPDAAHLDSSAWAYDHSRDAWLCLPLAFLLSDLPVSPHPVASTGGLLCFGCRHEFVVCNPITRSCRSLLIPLLAHTENGQSFEVAFDENSVEACRLICNSITGTYELFTIHHSYSLSEKESRMMHYSSSLSQWRVMPPLVMRETCYLYSNTITSCNSGLYTLWEKEESLVVFEYCNGSWTEIESPDGTTRSLKASLLDVHGSLHMVGGVGSVWLHDAVWGIQRERPTSIRIWKLCVESKEWMEVTMMPSSVLQEFRSLIDFDDVQWWGKNGVMYMKSFRSDVLMCDLGRNEWKWLKGLDLDVDLQGLIFEPSLSASA